MTQPYTKDPGGTVTLTPLPTDHWRPTHRGDCLTAARRWEVEALYGHDAPPDSDPVPAASSVRSTVDGRNATRPCVYVGCKYHVGVDYNVHTGDVVLTSAPDDDELASRLARLEVVPDPDQYHPTEFAAHTCGLDIADIAREDGSVTLEDVGKAVGKTRERIRQVSDGAFRGLKPHLGVLAAREGEDVRTDQGMPLDAESASRVRIASGTYISILLSRAHTLVVRCQGCVRAVTVRRSSLPARSHVLCRVCSRK